MTDLTAANTDIPPEQDGKPWGFFGTLGFGILAAIGYLLAQIVVLFVYAFGTGGINPEKNFESQIEALSLNGDFLSFAAISSTVMIILLILFFTFLRKNYPTKTYLGLKWPSWQTFFVWFGILVAVSLSSSLVFYLLGLPLKSQEMIDIYKSANYVTLFWITVVVAAPLSEEIFFRGFLLDGWKESFLGTYGAVLLTATIWGVIHLQYDAHIIIAIILMGIVLGMARVKTGSLYLVMILHAINNFIAMLVMHFVYLG